MTRIVWTLHRRLPEIVDEAKANALPRRPRWKRPIRNQKQYDEAVAFNKKLQAENPVPPWQKEMRWQLASYRGRAKMMAKVEPERKARECAELEAEATLRKVVAALESTLQNLNACRAPKRYDQRVYQKQIHNALFHLKTKCGVEFEPDEFSHKLVAMDQSQFTEEEDK